MFVNCLVAELLTLHILYDDDDDDDDDNGLVFINVQA